MNNYGTITGGFYGLKPFVIIIISNGLANTKLTLDNCREKTKASLSYCLLIKAI